MSDLPFVRRDESMRVAGKRIDTAERVPVHFPYTGETIGSVPAGNAKHVREAFDTAARYRPALSRYERQQILLNVAKIIGERKGELAPLITAELGISLSDARYECDRAIDVYTLTGQLCAQDDGQSFACDITPRGRKRRIFTTREPLTAISAITPFNHPLNMVSHKIAPAIATNNCIVVKPTELTPLTAIWLADVIYEAGLPPEMLSVVTGWPKDLGDEMITNEHIDLVTFTGGVSVGKMIAAKAVYKRQVLELGGNDPLIVCNDLGPNDLARAADLAVAGATANSGQRCTAVKRILCQESVADTFSELVLERAREITYGDPLDPATRLGTVISARAAEAIENRILAARDDGATLLHNPAREGAVVPPIVLDHVSPASELVMEETFGPVIPIIRVPENDREVQRISNSTAFGLSAGVCTNDFARMQSYVAGLNVGTVNIWEVPGYRTEMSPFGGIKDSGNGYKEGVVEAMKSYTNVKTFSLPWEQ